MAGRLPARWTLVTMLAEMKLVRLQHSAPSGRFGAGGRMQEQQAGRSRWVWIIVGGKSDGAGHQLWALYEERGQVKSLKPPHSVSPGSEVSEGTNRLCACRRIAHSIR